MADRHRVFVSFHHANDQTDRDTFTKRFDSRFDICVDNSVDPGDIDPNVHPETIRRKIRDEYLRDSTVTVVLIGTQTWQRKHVDWEIYSSLRDTTANARSGLLGILLPSYRQRFGMQPPDRGTLPPRLADNIDNGFATIHEWSNDPEVVKTSIHNAFLRKGRITPNNARPMFGKNRTTDRWTE